MLAIKHVILLALGIMISASVWASENGPKAVVEDTVNSIIEVLEARQDKTRLTTENRDAIRKIVKGRFDYRAMAMRSLGKPWKGIDAAQQAHFTEVFRELLERSYGNRLAEYKDQKVRFGKTKYNKKGTKAKMLSTVTDGTKETPVEYSLHQTKTGWQVYDIRIEGASLVRTFNQDFQTILKQGGYEHLLNKLEEKLVKLRAKDRA
ncbi:MAG: phospholipid-binding protein MlaC [Mariprofundaceae bacterium]